MDNNIPTRNPILSMKFTDKNSSPPVEINLPSSLVSAIVGVVLAMPYSLFVEKVHPMKTVSAFSLHIYAYIKLDLGAHQIFPQNPLKACSMKIVLLIIGQCIFKALYSKLGMFTSTAGNILFWTLSTGLVGINSYECFTVYRNRHIPPPAINPDVGPA